MTDRPSKEQFNPINPLELDDDAGLAFFHQIRELQKSAQFRGSADVIRLVHERVLGVGVIIRFHDSLKPEWQMITQHGLMPYNYGDNKPETLRKHLIAYPFSPLDYDPLRGGRPYVWGVDGIDFVRNSDVDRMLGIQTGSDFSHTELK